MKNLRSASVTVLISVLGVLLVSAAAFAQGCPKCGCQAGHCTAGIPGHLNCGSATSGEKHRVDERKVQLDGAMEKGLKTKTSDCNRLVTSVAEAYGYDGLKNKKADEIIEYLFAPGRIEKSMKEGWRIISADDAGKPRPLTVEDAIHYANAGQLVIGVMHSKLLNALKSPQDNNGAGYTHGHVFLVRGGGTVASRPEDSFRSLPVLNAGNGKEAEKTTANNVIPGWIRQPDHRDLIVFIALARP